VYGGVDVHLRGEYQHQAGTAPQGSFPSPLSGVGLVGGWKISKVHVFFSASGLHQTILLKEKIIQVNRVY
jgi:hypothetical protein